MRGGGSSADGDHLLDLRIEEALAKHSLTHHSGCTKDKYFHCFPTFTVLEYRLPRGGAEPEGSNISEWKSRALSIHVLTS